MALEHSCSGNYQVIKLHLVGENQKQKKKDAVMSTCLCILLACICLIHTQNFALTSSFTRSRRCQRYFVYPIWLWKGAQQNKGGMLEEAICQTFGSSSVSGFQDTWYCLCPLPFKRLILFLSSYNVCFQNFFCCYAVDGDSGGKLIRVWSVQRCLAMSVACDICGWCACPLNWGPLVLDC